MARSSPSIPVIVALALFFSIVIAFASLVTIVSAEEAPVEDSTTKPVDEPASEPLPDNATLQKMKVRELKALLAKKGPDAECLACTSKKEYVDRIHETAHWPDVKEEEKDAEAGTDDAPSMEELAAMFNKGRDSEEMAKLKKNLEAAGIDTSNIFSTGGDFDAGAFSKQFADIDPKHAADADPNVPPPKEDIHTDL